MSRSPDRNCSDVVGDFRGRGGFELVVFALAAQVVFGGCSGASSRPGTDGSTPLDPWRPADGSVVPPGLEGNSAYPEALQKAIMFYEFQRSGPLPAWTRNNWRGDSGLTDGSDVGLDLTGGWYDAGDHVKFNLPMAYAATMLAWSVYESRTLYERAGELDNILGNIKWATDYFIKCHPEPNVYYYQVGDGNKDHAWWGPAEAMQMERPSFKVTAAAGGSTVVAETAAALAAASLVFASRDPSYAATCLSHAKQLYTFAETTKSDAGYTAAASFYDSWSGFYDELTWAGAWLYLATNDQSYLDKAEAYVDNWARDQQSTLIPYKWGHCWDDVKYGAQILLARITRKPLYIESIERHLDWWSTGYEGSRITYSPKGLAWLSQWGSLRYATTESFLANVWADSDVCTPGKAEGYRAFAKSQIDYALGLAGTGASFEIGFGAGYPQHPHHRTAHSSWVDSQTTPESHRHVLVGALVGGPKAADDTYNDAIDDYYSNEVSCDYNAGFVGALAKMAEREGGPIIPDLNAVEPVAEDEYFVEAGVNVSGPTFVEIKALLNNRSGWPARVDDKLSFRYFFDISEFIEAGYGPSDITVTTNYTQGATAQGPFPFDAARNLYYVVLDFSGTLIYPGGQSAHRKEAQFRIAGPQNTTFFSAANDWSYQGVGDSPQTLVKTPRIPVYRDGEKIFGEEPQ